MREGHRPTVRMQRERKRGNPSEGDKLTFHSLLTFEEGDPAFAKGSSNMGGIFAAGISSLPKPHTELLIQLS